MVLQCRPKSLYRTYLHPDRRLRYAMGWYTQIGRRVWPYEILKFLREPLVEDGPLVSQFWGAPQDSEEQSMSAGRRVRPIDYRKVASPQPLPDMPREEV